MTSLVLNKQRRGDNGVIQNLRGLCDSVPPNLCVPVAPFIQTARAFHGNHANIQVVSKPFGIKVGKVYDVCTPLAGDRPVFDVIAQSKVAHSPTPAGKQYRRNMGESAKEASGGTL